MNTPEKISFLLDLFNCHGPVSYWNYDTDYRLLPTSSNQFDIIRKANLKKQIDKHLSRNVQNPLVIEISLGILWISGFEYDENALTGIHLVGPVFAGSKNLSASMQRLVKSNLPGKTLSLLSRSLAQIPVVPMNILANHAIMLHYTLNDKRILLEDVSYSVTDVQKTEIAVPKPPYYDRYGSWINEQELCKMFEYGDPNYKQILFASPEFRSGTKSEFGDVTRETKNNALVLLTLCSRSCIKGGLPPDIAYSLNDHYAKLIETAATRDEVIRIISDMTEDYTSRVRVARQQTSITTPIQEICYYIMHHLTEPDKLTIQHLSKKIGYTEYYFSHKFKKETGFSVNSFILQEKIKQAKFLLTGTNLSIQEISDSLAFSNRSYFSSCFQKQVGVSPTEYRKQPAKHS